MKIVKTILRTLSCAALLSPALIQAQETSESILINSSDVAAANLIEVNNLSPQLDALYLNQWVHVAKDGYVRGSVVALVGNDTVSLPKMRVTLFQDGQVVTSDDTDIDGNFLLEKIKPGRYTIVSESSKLLSIFALTILDEVTGKHLPNILEVRVLSTESGRVNEILRGQTLPKLMMDPIKNQDVVGANRILSDSHQVMLGADSSLSGQLGKQGIRVDMSSMMVFITKDGKEIKRTKVGQDGKFSVAGLPPGCYGLIAVGDQGVAATAFCATARQVAVAAQGREIFVSFEPKIPGSLNIEVGEPVTGPTVPKTEPTLEDIPAVPAPIGQLTGGAPMSGPVPGFGGGGGSIGASSGGLGLGGIAAIGGLTAAGVVAANRNNNSASALSPIVPN